jgi:protoporphyrinogen oxidase
MTLDVSDTSTESSESPNVAIIGGGISGLASAHYLASEGVHVTLFESTDRFGGLGTFFEYGGRNVEKFYHVMLPDDYHLLGILDELDVADQVHWQHTSLGYLYENEMYPLNRPIDLLRFRPAPLASRVRLGLSALYMSHFSRPGPLDDVSVEDWLIRLSGRTGFECLLRPLLEAKFGDAYRTIPALWYWSRFTREKGTKKEVKGYARGGYKAIADAIVSSLESRGARLLLNTQVQHLDIHENGMPTLTVDGEPQFFDRVISTIPLPLLRRTVEGGAIEPWLDRVDPEIDYQGVVNVLVVLRRPLTEHYWIAVVRSGAPFDGIVETTSLVDPEGEAGHHFVYLMNYVHRSHPLFERDPEGIAKQYVEAFLELFPELAPEDVIDSFVFRAPFVEPVYTPGYGRRAPPAELVPGRVYLATTTQVYPHVTSWNSSARVARETADEILENLAGGP